MLAPATHPVSSAASARPLLLGAIVLAECLSLYYGQRKLFWAVARAARSRLLAYLLAAPGTAAHELSHYLMALVLRVPAGRATTTSDGKRGKLVLFHPHEQEDGSITLGYVNIGACGRLRGTLIDAAPALLIPPALCALSALLLGALSLSGLERAIAHTPAWRVCLWAYLTASFGQAAFPSTGDRKGGRLGHLGLCLAALAAAALSWLAGGASALDGALGALALLLALPAAANAAGLLATGAL